MMPDDRPSLTGYQAGHLRRTLPPPALGHAPGAQGAARQERHSHSQLVGCLAAALRLALGDPAGPLSRVTPAGAV